MSSNIHGNLVIGESGGATAVINASLVGAFEAARDDDRVGGIYGMRFGSEGLLREDLIDLRAQPASLWPRLRDTPSAALGSSVYKLTDTDMHRMVEVLRRYNIRYVVYIGGGGSTRTVHRLAQAAEQDGYELFAISVPKTIDNDLPRTDHCPGYGSAARFMALSTMDSTANLLAVPSTHPIKVIEAMGRDVGWLTAASALGKHEDADPPHLLLVPEQPFNEQRFLQQVKAIHSRLGHAIIVTAEDIRDEQGQPVNNAQQQETNAEQSPAVNSTAQCLANLIGQQLQLQARFDRFGDLQWCSISSTDRDEAYIVGQEGTRALLRGETDKMVTLIRDSNSPYHCTSGLVELAQVVGQKRPLPGEYLDASKTMVTRAFYDYALPLLGDPLPIYPRLEEIKVRV